MEQKLNIYNLRYTLSFTFILPYIIHIIVIGLYFNQYDGKNHSFWISLPKFPGMKMSWD